MYVFVFSILFLLLLKISRNRGYRFLVYMQIVCFFSQFAIGLSCDCDSMFTLFNIIFTCICIYLIISPWRFVKIDEITVSQKYMLFLNRYFRPLLYFNSFIYISIAVVILLFFPNLADIKQQGYKNLYDSIPYFSIFFRYAYTTQLLGVYAVPLVFYNICHGNKKESIKWMIASLSSLVAGVALSSRANIISFLCTYIVFYLYIYKILDRQLAVKIKKISKITLTSFVIVFCVMSYTRFSRMDYLAERIPSESFTKDITTYYMVYYASQGFPYGIASLENYSPQKCMDGKVSFYVVYQALNFLGIIKWDSEDTLDAQDEVLGFYWDKFIGYTSYMVYEFGYIGAFFWSMFVYLVVRHLFRDRHTIRVKNMMYASLFLLISLNSVFYSCFSSIIMPSLFLIIMNCCYKFYK